MVLPLLCVSEVRCAVLQVIFQEPQRAITPQQAFVMYTDEVCLGSAAICHPGRSMWELQQLQCDAAETGT